MGYFSDIRKAKPEESGNSLMNYSHGTKKDIPALREGAIMEEEYFFLAPTGRYYGGRVFFPCAHRAPSP